MICTASAEESVPRWMAGRGKGWVTAEYGMLPASTGQRKARDATRGRQDGRTVEIQRLIGRSLRGVVDFSALFPVEVISRMLGVPEGERQQIREWLYGGLAINGVKPEDIPADVEL